MRKIRRLVVLFLLQGLVGLSAVAQQVAPSDPHLVTLPQPSSASGMGQMPFAELQTLATEGNAAAQNALALRYRLGSNGADKDRDKAFEWFHKAALNGSTRACFNLGVEFYNGEEGVPRNPDVACKWFYLASEGGDPNGKEALERSVHENTSQRMAGCEVMAGDAYLVGKEVRQDYALAMKAYLKAADRKFGKADERIAAMYERGLGVAVDKTASLQWLQRSANLGNASAIYAIGQVYQKGIGVSVDSGRAVSQFEKAAYVHYILAMLALGNIYQEGSAMLVDPQKAYMWYLVAMNFGSPEGETRAKALQSKLTSKQLADGKTEAQARLRKMLHSSFVVPD
jgi:TPR repeat protein